MSTFDYVVTVAIGAIVGRVVLVRTTLVAGILGLAMLFLLQSIIAYLRNHTRWRRVIDNGPTLLLRDGRVLSENLEQARMSEEDVYEQVRLSGSARLGSVRAVVLERNGKVSVVRSDDGAPVDECLFRSVGGWSG